jgi:hypothetical protein
MTDTATQNPTPVQATDPAQPVQATDPAEQILRSASGLDDNTKANAWDAFHNSASEDDLAGKLQGMNIPQDVKANLWDAKHTSKPAAPAPASNLNKVENFNADEANAEKNVAIGAAKGVGQTIVGGTSLMNKALEAPLTLLKMIPGVQQKLDDWNPNMGKVDDYLKAATGKADATLEQHGIAQNVGGVAETVAEYLLGEGELKAGATWADKSGEVSKITKIVEKYPRLARVVTNAMRADALGGAQNLVKTGGANPVGSAEVGAVAGGTTGALEGVTEFGLKPAATRLFSWVNAPKNLEAAEAALQATRESSPEALSAAKESVLPSHGLEGASLADEVQEKLEDAKAKMSTDYEAARKSVASQIEAARNAGTEIRVGGDGSPLQKAAVEFSQAPSGLPEGFDSVFDRVNPARDEKIAPLLDQFANEATQPMAWDEAEKMRQEIGKAVRNTPYGDPTKWQWISMRDAMDESMEKAATDAGHPEISQDMNTLRSNYADAVNSLDKNTLAKALRTKDFDSVATQLMRGNQVGQNVQNLRKVLSSVGGEKTMQSVESSVFQKLLDKSTTISADGTRSVNPNALTKQFFGLSQDVRDALYGENADAAAKIVDDYRAEFQTNQAAVASGKKTIEEVNQSIFSPNNPITRYLGGHAVAAPFLGTAAYKASHGDFSGAAEDAAYGLAAGAAQKRVGIVLESPAVQSKVLSFLEYLSRTSAASGADLAAGTAAAGTATALKPPAQPDNQQ